jgi:hypothetical protein
MNNDICRPAAEYQTISWEYIRRPDIFSQGRPVPISILCYDIQRKVIPHGLNIKPSPVIGEGGDELFFQVAAISNAI